MIARITVITNISVNVCKTWNDYSLRDMIYINDMKKLYKIDLKITSLSRT